MNKFIVKKKKKHPNLTPGAELGRHINLLSFKDIR